MKKEPVILITNDDGIMAPGLAVLVEIMKDFGKVIVVAPDSPQSAQGHALTISAPLRLNKVERFEGIESYECSGTPVDCVKIAKSVILKGRKADLCVSGINHGSNAALNVIYSGTVSAAMEASLEEINSIGFSLCDFSMQADFEPFRPYIREIVTHVLDKGMGNTRLLNVNFPRIPSEDIKGLRICRQANAKWVEEFVEGKDPHGGTYYWLSGEFVNFDKGTDTDIWALDNGYISIVPVHHDLTNYQAMDSLQDLVITEVEL